MIYLSLPLFGYLPQGSDTAIIVIDNDKPVQTYGQAT